MGYCHYWGRQAELPLIAFRSFVEECVTLRRALGVPRFGLFGGVKIGDSSGWAPPVFREDVICFNGRPGCEPLIIHRVFHQPQREPGDFGLYWDFVKTNAQPYRDCVSDQTCDRAWLNGGDGSAFARAAATAGAAFRARPTARRRRLPRCLTSRPVTASRRRPSISRSRMSTTRSSICSTAKHAIVSCSTWRDARFRHHARSARDAADRVDFTPRAEHPSSDGS